MEGVNTKLGAWLLDQLAGQSVLDATKKCSHTVADSEEPRIRGWTFLDYYLEPEGGNLVPLLVECNYRGRKEGEEGW